MFPHVLEVLGKEHRETLLDEARRARLAPRRRQRKASRLLGRIASYLGNALIVAGARLQKVE